MNLIETNAKIKTCTTHIQKYVREHMSICVSVSVRVSMYAKLFYCCLCLSKWHDEFVCFM